MYSLKTFRVEGSGVWGSRLEISGLGFRFSDSQERSPDVGIRSKTFLALIRVFDLDCLWVQNLFMLSCSYLKKGLQG